MLTVKQVANELGVSAACVYQLVASGMLVAHRIGLRSGRIRVAEADLDHFIGGARNEKRPDQPAAYIGRKSRDAFKHLRLNCSLDSVDPPNAEGIEIGVDRREPTLTDRNDQAG